MKDEDQSEDRALEFALATIAERSGATAALLALTDGKLVAYAGPLLRAEAESLAALVAEAVAGGRLLADGGEVRAFVAPAPGGESARLYARHIGDSRLLVTAFWLHAATCVAAAVLAADSNAAVLVAPETPGRDRSTDGSW